MGELCQYVEGLSLSAPALSCVPGQLDDYDTDLEPEESVRATKDVSWRELYLQACQQAGVVPVSYFLRHMDETHMKLNHHGLGPRGARAIAVALVSNTSVTHLHLEDNWIEPEGVSDLVAMLCENCYIQELNLSNNRLGVRGSEVISRMLLDNVSLKCVKLAQNKFNDESAKHFAAALSANFRVTELDLSHNKFCEKAGEELGQMLAANEGLQVLDLSWNHIRMKGAIALSAGLRVNGMLKVLNLSHNGFGNEGALALGEALRANSSLLHLDISCNRISNEGARLLSKGLDANETLRGLKLSMNPLTVEGAIVLLTTISKRPECKLEELDISNVLVNQRFLSLLEAASLARPALRVSYAGERGFIVKKPACRPDPMRVIQNYLDDHKLRLLDFFKNMDKDGSMRIPVSDFRRHVSHAGLPLDGAQMDALVQRLDKEQTGSVDYRDLVDSRKQMMREKRVEQRRRERRERQERQRSERALRSFHTAVRALTPPPASRGVPRASASPTHFADPLSSWYQEGGSKANPRSPHSRSGSLEEAKASQKPEAERYYSSQGSLGSQCLSEPLTPDVGSPSPCDQTSALQNLHQDM
ncbi:leucine-rich repeat-containing protein 74A [Ascaphus truei]|uniref:leucine-rich repeat-containing protein 74A n=1 Tax=Ascaphus truei TaxID=8439 RepID=UPI003F59A685